ncbi:MAG: rane protein [Ramlibacter sp.]|nr:rane protein [Ramlibacter sp.]
MTPTPTCRLATLDDLAAVCSLAEDLAAIHHAAWPGVFAPASGGDRDAPHWRDSIAGPGRAGFVAEVGGEPVGFVTVASGDESHSLLQPTRWARVNSICVLERARGQGVGRALMERAEAWARFEGAEEIRLVVWAFNARAVHLYEELGYAVRALAMGKEMPS